MLRINNLQSIKDMYKMKPLLVKIGMCALNNDPLNFSKNFNNIMKSIQICKDIGCKVRMGAELQIPGYSCGDHFNEYDTITHSWEMIGKILESGISQGIICDIGSPVLHHGNCYNSRIVIYNNKIVGIRPKMILADGDNYFETRWFGFWRQKKQISDFKLPRIIQDITGQNSVPIGEFLIDANDTCLGYEICEQSWISNNPMIDAALDGVEIVLNPSASYVERDKIRRKIQMIKEFTQRHGGAYLYTNVKGSVGDRTYFQGGCMFTQNGRVKGLSPLNTLDDIIVTPAICNLTKIRTFRLSNKSFLKSTNGVKTIPRINLNINIATCEEPYISENPDEIIRIVNLTQDYQFPHVRYEPSLFLWDYLRKSKAGGFFLPLSGGLDSCTVALIVYNLCTVVFSEIHEKKKENVLQDLRNIVADQSYTPQSAECICKRILYTCYMGTKNSSEETKNRADLIAKTLNSSHRAISFQEIFQSYRELCSKQLQIPLNFEKNGGSWRTDLALQNIQARSRMVISYMFAQTQFEKLKRKGFLLVLGSSNLDESLRGYFTKYDCSSADINPIGSFSKLRLKQFLRWNQQVHDFKFIKQILQATPTAELRPLKEGEIAQTDEEDMGLTYKQLFLFGRMRRIDKLGPVSMFQTVYTSGNQFNARILGEKIKLFFRSYSTNRHKVVTLTPSFHYEPEGCDDNRLDMRPFMYETDWSYQFSQIDQKVEELQKLQKEKA